MDKEEIERAIELELKKLKDFSRLVEKFPLGEEIESAYINERLDRINELKKELEKLQ